MKPIKYITLTETSPKDTVISIKSDTNIRVEGKVIIKQILVAADDVNINIEGDELIVNNTDEGICIGEDANFGISYGRYSLRSARRFTLNVLCREFHTYSKTPNVSIGTYGVETNAAVFFSPNCIHDAQLQNRYPYIDEVLSGSTKFSVRPVYITKDEIKVREDAKDAEKFRLLGQQYVPSQLLYQIKDILVEHTPLKLYSLLQTTYDNAGNSYKAKALISICAAVSIAFDDSWETDYIDEICAFFIFANAQECVNKKTLPRITLPMRLYTLFQDHLFVMISHQAVVDPTAYNAITDLAMTPEVAKLYGLEDKFTGGPIKRFLWGFNMIDWPDNMNELVTGDYATLRDVCLFAKPPIAPVSSGDIKLNAKLQVVEVEDNVCYQMSKGMYDRLLKDIKI